MKKFFNKIIKLKFFEEIVLFFILCILYFHEFLEFCTEHITNNFDTQALLLWNYSVSKGMMPFRDIFYPYGFLSYYKDANIFLHIISFLIIPFLLTFLFFIFKKTWNNRCLALVSLLFFYIFVSKYTSLDMFYRNGVIVIVACFLSYISYCYEKLSRRFVFIFGIVSGLIFSLIIDQGIYIVILFSVFFFLFSVLHGKTSILSKKDYFVVIFNYFVFYFFGVIVGIIPLVLFLIYNNAYSDFVLSNIRLSHIALYAKTPFTPYAKSPENIFVFSMLILSITSIAVSLINREKKSFIILLQTFLIIVLILLEQKSLIRSIDRGLTFIGFLLLLILLTQFNHILTKKFNLLSIFLYYCLFLSFFIFYNPFQLHNALPVNRNTLRENACIANNENIFIKNYPEYRDVLEKIKKDPKFNGKIFSFPGDPVFYVLFNQLPPYYPSTYESTPLYSQNQQIEYIKKNKINIIIYNLSIPSIQDGLPHYIRNSYEYRYIINNFIPEKKIGNFLILKRSIKQDFFKNKNRIESTNLTRYLLNINLESIPKLEGKYKSKSFLNNKTILYKGSLMGINKYLKTYSISSDRKILLLSDKSKSKNDKLLLYVDSFTTEISYTNCSSPDICLINLSHIPLFYKNRNIKKIYISLSKDKIFWLIEDDTKEIW